MATNAIEFLNIIPADSVLTLANGVASIFALILSNNGELLLSKYAENRTVLWSKRIGSFGRDNIPRGRPYTLMEDEQSFIHIIMGYSNYFEPFFVDQSEDDLWKYNTLILKLANNGDVIDIRRYADLGEYNLVKIVNDVWGVVSRNPKKGINCVRSIMIQNLTKGGNITNITSSGFISVTDAFFMKEKLFVTLNASQNISYRGQEIPLDRGSAVLAIIDTNTWELINYFVATPKRIINPECPVENPFEAIADNSCVNQVSFLATVVNLRDQYYITGRVIGESMLLYHRTELIREFSFETESTLIICRISRDEEDDLDVRFVRLPAYSKAISKIQLFHMVRDNHIMLLLHSNDFPLLDYLQLARNFHVSRFFLMLRFNSNLQLQNVKTLGSGSLENSRAACDCNNCDDYDNFYSIPCRVMRLFPPGVTNAIDNNPDIFCTDQTGTRGFSQVIESSNFNPVAPNTMYTCFRQNGHCLARPGFDQPGDLYNTKYQGISLVQPDSITQSSSLNLPQQESLFAITQTDAITIGGTFIDNLVIDNVPEKILYKQKWFGYLVNFSYN